MRLGSWFAAGMVAVGGLVGSALAFAAEADRLLGVFEALFVIGALALVVRAYVLRRDHASDETFRLGYDCGYEAGYGEARRAPDRADVIDIERRRRHS